ncbi:MAG: MbnP family protein [Saprospiraceae bacterium]
MKNTLLSIALSLFAMTLIAQDNEVKFVFDHQVGGQPLTLGTTTFDLWNNKKVQLSRAEFYLSGITLIDENGVETELTDKHLLVKANQGEQTYNVGTWNVGSVKAAKVHVGVHPDFNHLDPTTYPAGHPLAMQNPSMHWGWTAGYFFMAIEGKVDNNGDGTVETTFQYHNLGDDLYFMAELDGLCTAENGTLTIPIKLEYANLFKDLDLSGNVIHHGSSAQNELMLKNSVDNNFMVMEGATASDEILANSDAIQIAPNPADHSAQLVYDFGKITDQIAVAVHGMAGQVVVPAQQLPSSGTYQVITSNLPAGIYQVVFSNENELIARKKLLVVH